MNNERKPILHCLAQLVRTSAVVAVLIGFVPAFAQLDAPGALSNFAGCSDYTCTWVPYFAPKTFWQGDLSYTVDNSGDFLLYRGSRQLLKTPLKDLDASVSVAWSDDKKEFAVTWSDGGATGGFHVRGFRIEGNTVTELPVAQKAFVAFKARHWCETRGDNEQAYGWLPDSHRLVLVLSVYPTSDCGAEMGYTEAYVVNSATGDIQEHWSQKELDAYMKAHPE